MRARGSNIALAPVVDVARDPRWGRIEETYGEDPHLCAEIGLAAIRGFQGKTLPLAKDKVFVTLKHMTGHGQPENGTNVGPAQIAERTLRENFFPPFERAVKELPVRSVMPSYNEIDGVPSHANRWLLHDVLRQEWGFKGVGAMSDYFAIKELIARHKLTDNLADTAVMAMNATVDVELPDGEAYALLPELVKSGCIPQAPDRRGRGAASWPSSSRAACSKIPMPTRRRPTPRPPRPTPSPWPAKRRARRWCC
jgi:beta-glucosidase